MDRLDAMAIFVTVVDEGSMAAAARKLGRSPATVTRAVVLLEGRLGERLMHRTSRKLQLTNAGEHYVAVCRAVLTELKEAEGGTKQGSRLEGIIGITAPELFGQYKVMPIVEDFLGVNPGVRARVLLLNRIVNLADEGMDIAVRLAPLPDSGILAVRLGELRRLVCAAPSYLRNVKAPESPSDLQRHACIGVNEGNDRELWRFVDRAGHRGRTQSVGVNPRIAVNSAGAAVDAAVRGSGVCRALSYQVVEHIAARRLVPILRAYEPDPTPVHLVFHPIPRRNATLRSFVDYAIPRLQAELASISAKTAQTGRLRS